MKISSKPQDYGNDFLVKHSRALNHVNVLHWSLWGVLARRGLIKLTTFNGAYLPGLVWVNFLACFTMGFVLESERVWTDILHGTSFDSKKQIPLFLGLTTGFCGSFSSFSSFILEAFYKSSNQEIGAVYVYPTKGYAVLQFLMVVTAHMGLSVVGIISGKNLIRASDDHLFVIKARIYKFVELSILLLTVSSYVVIIFLLGFKSGGSWRSWTFSCLFAPLGSFLRYYLSVWFNSRRPDFPVGTFLANFIGTFILSIATLLIRGRSSHSHTLHIVDHITGCHVLDGISDGFCGCLTTVSTFAGEIVTLKPYNAYIYAISSIIISFCFLVLTLGVYSWKVGLISPICSL